MKQRFFHDEFLGEHILWSHRAPRELPCPHLYQSERETPQVIAPAQRQVLERGNRPVDCRASETLAAAQFTRLLGMLDRRLGRKARESRLGDQLPNRLKERLA